jgi:hypothetical protein
MATIDPMMASDADGNISEVVSMKVPRVSSGGTKSIIEIPALREFEFVCDRSSIMLFAVSL